MAGIVTRPPWRLMEWRGCEMDQSHLFPFGWEKKEALPHEAKGFWLESLSASLYPMSPALYQIKTSEQEQPTGLTNAPLDMYALQGPPYPACVLMLLTFWCFKRWMQSLSFLTFQPQEALKWVGWRNCRSIPVLSDILEGGPSCVLFSKGFPGGFDGLFKIAF